MTDERSLDERSLTLAVSGLEIPARLTLPLGGRGGAWPASAILLVPGSLFSDVDGDYPVWNSRPHAYAHLARQLAARGHAVYRYAKSGPGTGTVVADQEAAARVQSWPGRMVVGRAALSHMRTQLHAALDESLGAGARNVPVILAGHSEGAVVVSILAQTEAVDGVVLLSGPSVGLLGIMREQHAAMVGHDAAAMAAYDEALGHIRRGEPIPEPLRSRPDLRMLASMPTSGFAYLRDVDAADPAQAIAQVRRPVLIVQGGRDPNVGPHHAERLRAARGALPTELLLIPELQHFYKVLPEGITGPAAFGIEGETDPRVAEGIDRWMKANGLTANG